MYCTTVVGGDHFLHVYKAALLNRLSSLLYPNRSTTLWRGVLLKLLSQPFLLQIIPLPVIQGSLLNHSGPPLLILVHLNSTIDCPLHSSGGIIGVDPTDTLNLDVAAAFDTAFAKVATSRVFEQTIELRGLDLAQSALVHM